MHNMYSSFLSHGIEDTSNLFPYIATKYNLSPFLRDTMLSSVGMALERAILFYFTASGKL